MSRKVIVYIAMSLDGYIATEDESLEWLFNTEGEGDNGYSEFYDTVDTIIMGRRTYDWIIKMEKGKFPYPNKKCYVFSKSLQGSNDNIEYVNENVKDFLGRILEIGDRNIWIVGGGELLYYFVKENLVDEFIINIAPTVIGSGIPLFVKDDYVLELELKSLRRFNQFAELHYIKKNLDQSYK
jgi:dihydrofolate reductase